jgi:hypothetical protein
LASTTSRAEIVSPLDRVIFWRSALVAISIALAARPLVERVDPVRVDQDGRNSRATEHGGCGRAGEATPDDRNVGIVHVESRPGCDIFAPGKANKALARRPALDQKGWE